jgi:hypothetical protein
MNARARRGLAFGIVVISFTGVAGAPAGQKTAVGHIHSVASSATERQFIAGHFGARMAPTAIVEHSTTANGRLVGEVGSDLPGCVAYCLWARYRLVYWQLSSSPTQIAIRSSRTGKGTWRLLCGSSLWGRTCPRSRSGTLRGEIDLPQLSARTFDLTFPRAMFVEIRTANYPSGELRGQIRLR